MANSNGKIGAYIIVAAMAFAAGRCSVDEAARSPPVAVQPLLRPAEDAAMSAPAPSEAPTDDPAPTTLVSEPAALDEAEERSVYYAGCADARADGAAPIHAGEPGYASHLDRDSDGVACE